MNAARQITDADIDAIAERVVEKIRAPRPRMRRPDEPRKKPSDAARAKLAKLARRKGW